MKTMTRNIEDYGALPALYDDVQRKAERLRAAGRDDAETALWRDQRRPAASCSSRSTLDFSDRLSDS